MVPTQNLKQQIAYSRILILLNEWIREYVEFFWHQYMINGSYGEVMTRGSSLLTLGSTATYTLENDEFNWKRLRAI